MWQVDGNICTVILAKQFFLLRNVVICESLTPQQEDLDFVHSVNIRRGRLWAWFLCRLKCETVWGCQMCTTICCLYIALKMSEWSFNITTFVVVVKYDIRITNIIEWYIILILYKFKFIKCMLFEGIVDLWAFPVYLLFARRYTGFR